MGADSQFLLLLLSALSSSVWSPESSSGSTVFVLNMRTSEGNKEARDAARQQRRAKREASKSPQAAGTGRLRKGQKVAGKGGKAPRRKVVVVPPLGEFGEAMFGSGGKIPLGPGR